MTQHNMLSLVQEQLAIDLNCSVSDLNGEKDSLVFVAYKENQGRRPFPRSSHHFEMLSMGNSIIVSATPDIMNIIKPELSGKDRDNAFSIPYILGHSLYYLPDLGVIKPLSAPSGFDFEMAERNDMLELYKNEGFHNSLSYDINHSRPDVIAFLAKHTGKVVGMAGASADCEKMWQVGMDVLPDYRNHGLAAYLVNNLTIEILRRGIIPYYGTASSNVASQRVAHRAGFLPIWICAYRGRFEGMDVSPTS